MGSLSDFSENTLLDEMFGAVDYTPAATLYFGLSTTTITDAGGNITEPVANGYARVAVTNNTTNFPAAVGGTKSNGTAITFPQATGAWGTVTDFLISDAASGGNILGAGALTTPRTIGAADNPASYAAGALTWALT